MGTASLLACNPTAHDQRRRRRHRQGRRLHDLARAAPRAPPTGQASIGRAVFSNVGCSHCHWDTFRTGDSPVQALDHVTFHPYSDFLLHDMGSLGDGLEIGDGRVASSAPRRSGACPPCTGYLHDGRATTLKDAILAHDGQGKRARERFSRLSDLEQKALFAFVNSL